MFTEAKIEAFRKHLEEETLEAGRKGGEAFTRAKHAIAEYWLCIEFKYQYLHDLYCRHFGLKAPSPHSSFREHIAASRRKWRETHDPIYKHYKENP